MRNKKKERAFRKDLKRELKRRFPGCIFLKGDSADQQGLPDLIILYQDTWAALETKRENNSPVQMNQEYYVELMNKMSFAAIVCPENKEVVLSGLQRTFSLGRKTCIS